MPKGFKDLTSSIRAPFYRKFGLGNESSLDYAKSNNFPELWSNAAGTDSIEGIRIDSDDALRVGGEVVTPFRQSVTLAVPLNAGMVDQTLFVVPYGMTVTGIKEIHATAGNDAGAVTINLTKDTGTTVPGAGTTIMSGTFDAKGTVNTLQDATLTTADPTLLTFAAGDRIGVNFTGTATALAGLVITLFVTPGGKGSWATYRSVTGGVSNQCLMVVNRPTKISAIYYVHSTAGTDASAVTANIEKLTSTTAPGSGTTVQSGTFNCKGTINSVQTATLTATAANLWFAAGDRIGIKFTGTTTALAGVVVVVVFEQAYERTKTINFVATANADCVDRAFFIADRAYWISDVRYVNATAGNDASAVNVQLTVDNLTDAPGAGTDVLSNNTNAGFNCKGTANTVQAGTFISDGVRYVLPNQRISADFAGTVTTLAGVVMSVTLTAV